MEEQVKQRMEDFVIGKGLISASEMFGAYTEHPSFKIEQEQSPEERRDKGHNDVLEIQSVKEECTANHKHYYSNISNIRYTKHVENVPHRDAGGGDQRQHQPWSLGPIGDRIMIADHDEQHRQRHVIVVQTAPLARLTKRRIGHFACG